MLLPALARAKARAQRINCTNNLKQIGLASKLFAGDNGDYPQKLSVAQGGCSDSGDLGVASSKQSTATASKGAFRVFQIMSNELSTPKVVTCPSEYEAGRQ